jgi:SAM-dependent methyltransferase
VPFLERLFQRTDELNRKTILDAMRPAPGGRLLDLGCGDGQFTVQLARRSGVASMNGVEGLPERARLARAAGVEVVVSDLEGRLPFADDSFDVVHSNQVIEHLSTTDLFLSEIRRVLVPSGFAVISTNNLASWHNVMSLVLGWQPLPCCVSDEFVTGNPVHPGEGGPLRVKHHLRVFTGRALRDLAAHHGLALELDAPNGYYPLPPSAARVAARLDRRHSVYLVQRFVPAVAV